MADQPADPGGEGMSTTRRWLNWTPSQPQIMETPEGMEPTKASKTTFVGFDSSGSGENPIIRPADQQKPADLMIEKGLDAELSKKSKIPEGNHCGSTGVCDCPSCTLRRSTEPAPCCMCGGQARRI